MQKGQKLIQKNRRYNKLQLFLKILILLSVLFTAYTGKTQTFTDIGAGLSGLSSTTGAWGDYDNDGKLDILFRELNQLVIYRNFSQHQTQHHRLQTERL